MKKVITYGTYDLLHHGHIRLLERAKALGDYLIVGVTAEDFDKNRGKINVKQSLMERIESVRATGLADEIIIEEYEGQKIDDIRRYGIDIFAIGSDWNGKFDYLSEFCTVKYLERTEGISSTEIRKQKNHIRIGLIGKEDYLTKFIKEATYVDDVSIRILNEELLYGTLEDIDAVYLISHPEKRYEQVSVALSKGKHVLCESPIAMSVEDNSKLQRVAKENNCILMEAIKTAYATAYNRLILLAKSGAIGDIVSVESTCTSLSQIEDISSKNIGEGFWGSICTWGPMAMLPVFHLLGTNYKKKEFATKISKENNLDLFTRVNYIYSHAVASIKVAKGVKSEGELIISGTKGYIYVPAPWWKTDYFELRFENPVDNKRYFYQLDGEGIRYEIVAFVKAIEMGKLYPYIHHDISMEISKNIEDFYNKFDLYEI